MNVLTGWFGPPDDQAMWLVQMHDDAEAFSHLVSRWEGPIQRLCLRMVGDPHKAQDLTQEAFARIYSRRKEYQHGAKFSTFLWRVAVNLCLDELRRTKRRREWVPLQEGADGESEPWREYPSPEQGPDDRLQAEEEAEMVRMAVLQLPEHYRSVVILRHYENLKFREIAEVLEIAEGTVKSRMAEALTLLNGSIRRAMNGKLPSISNRKESLFL